MKTIKYNLKDIEVLDSADAIIIGGGTAGVVAAISALNEKKSVIIIEKAIALGGTQTNGKVIPFMGSVASKMDGLNVLLNDEYIAYDNNAFYNGRHNALFASPVTYSMFLDYKVNSLGGKIYYDSTFIDSIKQDNKIKYVIVFAHNKLYAFEGKCFVDTSAEGLLAQSAGLSLMHGNEANNNKHQSVSLRYEMGGVDKVRLCDWLKSINYVGFGIPQNPQDIEFIKDPSFDDVILKGVENGDISLSDMRYIQAFKVPGMPNTFAFNGPQLGDKYNIDDPVQFSQAISDGLALIRRYSKFLIKYIPGFENAFISSMASQLGIRESVRVVTDYVLQNEDYTKRARFDDGIAKADWYVDVHADDISNEDIEKYEDGEYYEVPYRSLISSLCDNLIIGGRIIGCSFRVEASVRIQITLRDISEVIGKAIAYSLDNNIDLNKIDGSIFKVK